MKYETEHWFSAMKTDSFTCNYLEIVEIDENKLFSSARVGRAISTYDRRAIWDRIRSTFLSNAIVFKQKYGPCESLF
ncbi:hypothetical protein BN1088_40014 [Sphingobacterium sp. PM2-P1-29]|nr:hypothetical protein BN1088_40014 [Sphingobacterium sp. PM2-P1-29]